MTARLKRMVGLNTACSVDDERPYVALENLESGSGRFVPGVELPVRPAPDTGAASVEVGDVLFGKLRPYLAKSWLADRPVYASTELLCLRPQPALDRRWLSYLVRSTPFVDWAVASSDGTKMPRTSWDKLGEFTIEVPDVAIQSATADFLDAETARIDALIEKKQHLVELLTQRVASSFLNLVLGKLKDEPKFDSPSGVYGPLPRSWSETSLRHFSCEVQTGPFGSQLHAEDYVDDGWPVVNPMNLTGGVISDVPGMTITDEKRQELARHILQPGDIVFGRRGEMGRAGLVGDAQAGWLCGTGSLRLRLRDPRLSPGYLKLLLETAPARAYFQLSSVGSTMDNLNSEILLAFPTVAPPVDAQVEIEAVVADARQRVEQLHARLRAQLSLLADHRQALITAAVTGELSVPGIAA